MAGFNSIQTFNRVFKKVRAALQLNIEEAKQKMEIAIFDNQRAIYEQLKKNIWYTIIYNNIYL